MRQIPFLLCVLFLQLQVHKGALLSAGGGTGPEGCEIHIPGNKPSHGNAGFLAGLQCEGKALTTFVLFAAALYSHRKPARGFTFFAANPKQIHKIESLLKKTAASVFPLPLLLFLSPQQPISNIADLNPFIAVFWMLGSGNDHFRISVSNLK